MKSLLAAFTLWTLLLLTSTVAIAAPVKLYVSTNGNDAWSGRFPRPNKSRTDGPFATLTGARDHIRSNYRGQSVTVFVRGGTYWMAEPFVLEPQDSGTPEAPFAYVAFKKSDLCSVVGDCSLDSARGGISGK